MSWHNTWRFREDILSHYINPTSGNTFQDAQDRLNYLEKKEEWCNQCHYSRDCSHKYDYLKSNNTSCSYYS